MTLAYTELKKFEGIGSKVAEKLVKYFGGELEAVNAIKNYKVTEIAAIRGISFKKAFKLVNDYREKQIGISLEEILRSQEIKRIHESILKIASSYANTMQGRDAISLYFPLPRSKIELIQERIDYFNDAKNCVEMLDTKNIKEMKFLLSKVKPLKITGSSVIRKKLILVDDEEDYQNILEEDLTKFCDIDLIDRRKLEDEEFFIEASNNYDLIFIISSQNYTFLEEFENIIYLNEFELMKIIPENVLNVFALNKITIKAARELYKKILRLKENKSIKKFQDPNDLEILNEINEFLNLINPDGTLKEDINPEIFKLRQNLDEFDGFLHDLEYEINESITNQINGLEIKLSGNQILDILKVGSGLDENELDIRKYLPEEISEIIQNELKESINKILDAFDLKKNDEELVFPLFENETGTLPIEVNKLEAKKLKKIIEKIFTFDEFFAIGLFSTEYGLNPPRISQDDIGVSFQRGFNLFLKENVLEVDDFRVEKVNYKIGVSPLFDEETQNERTIILSGANSGGKTCLLQTIAQISIMAQMGILVPAETCIVSIFDELYYYEKSSGMLNSGAFEASLRQLIILAFLIKLN